MKKYLFIFLFVILCCPAIAQGDDPGLPGGDPDVPLDGGVGFLLLAGAVYGVKKIRQFRP